MRFSGVPSKEVFDGRPLFRRPVRVSPSNTEPFLKEAHRLRVRTLGPGGDRHINGDSQRKRRDVGFCLTTREDESVETLGAPSNETQGLPCCPFVQLGPSEKPFQFRQCQLRHLAGSLAESEPKRQAQSTCSAIDTLFAQLRATYARWTPVARSLIRMHPWGCTSAWGLRRRLWAAPTLPDTHDWP